MRNLYLIEYYQMGPKKQPAWEINFAWVWADTKEAAIFALQEHDKKFSEVIQTTLQSEITPLSGVPNVLGIEVDLQTGISKKIWK